jgi:hypothetical protein
MILVCTYFAGKFCLLSVAMPPSLMLQPSPRPIVAAWSALPPEGVPLLN